MKPDFGNFLERMNFVLAGRRPFVWGKAVGLSTGTMSRITSGHVPGADILGLISRVENCSVSWLLTGQGNPYLVHRHDRDADLSDDLRAHLVDEPWRLHLLEDGARAVVVLTLQAALGEGDGAVGYTAVEAFCGPFGPVTADLVRQYVATAARCAEAEISAACGGRVGSYQLLEWITRGNGGESKAVAEVAGQYEGVGMLSREEQLWVEKYRLMDPAGRTHAQAVVDALAHATGREGESATG